MLAEQRLEVAGALGDPRRRRRRRPRRSATSRAAQPPDQAVHALAHPPGELDLLGVAGEVDRADRARGRRGSRSARGDLGGRARRRSSAPNSTSSTADSGRQLLPLLGRADHVPGGGDQGRRDHQLDRGRAAVDQLADRRDRLVDAGKWIQAVVVRAGTGTVSKTASAMKASVPSEPTSRRRKISSGSIGVEEGAEPVAGRVLDRELAPDPLAELVVGADLVADRLEPARRAPARRRRSARRRPGRRCRSSSPTAGRRSASAPSSRSRAVDPAAHPARVVGDHPADGGDVGAGRVGAELAAVGREDAVGVAEDRPGPDPRPRPLVLDRDAAEVAADVDEDAVALPLAVEAGAAGAEGDRDAGAAPVLERPWRRRRRRAPSPPPSAAGGRGWRRRRSGRCRWRGPGPGRRRAGRRGRRAAAAACRPRARRGRGREPAPRRAARYFGAPAAPSALLEEGHPGLDRDLDQLRPRGADRGRQRVPRPRRDRWRWRVLTP